MRTFHTITCLDEITVTRCSFQGKFVQDHQTTLNLTASAVADEYTRSVQHHDKNTLNLITVIPSFNADANRQGNNGTLTASRKAAQ